MPGLGLGLLCAAIEQLKLRGVTSCFVDWVVSQGFVHTDFRYRIKIGTRSLGLKYSGSTRKVGKLFKTICEKVDVRKAVIHRPLNIYIDVNLAV